MFFPDNHVHFLLHFFQNWQARIVTSVRQHTWKEKWTQVSTFSWWLLFVVVCVQISGRERSTQMDTDHNVETCVHFFFLGCGRTLITIWACPCEKMHFYRANCDGSQLPGWTALAGLQAAWPAQYWSKLKNCFPHHSRIRKDIWKQTPGWKKTKTKLSFNKHFWLTNQCHLYFRKLCATVPHSWAVSKKDAQL